MSCPDAGLQPGSRGPAVKDSEPDVERVRSRVARRGCIDVTALRRAVLGAFVVGLGTSITLSESALALLTLLWLWRLRDPEARAAARWPLWQPVLAFTAVSLVSALASGHPAPRSRLQGPPARRRP